jgi:hypothetical protein
VKFRAVGAAAVALAAALLLSGCGGSNVGVAAKFDGQQISQTQVSNYVTPDAKGVQLSSTSSALTPPKAFVLFIVIRERLYADLLRATKGGAPSPGAVSGLVDGYVGSSTPQQTVAKLGVKGYAPSFARQVLRYRALGQLLDNRANNHVDVNGALTKLKYRVSINPRYGAWDPKALTVKTDGTAGLPDFLTLQPGSSTTG